MDQSVKCIYDRRRRLSGIASTTAIGPLTSAEVAELELWVRSQQRITSPDMETWRLLFESRVLLADSVERVFGDCAMKRQSLLYASHPIQKPEAELVCWPALPDALRFMLSSMHKGGVLIFDAPNPVIMSADFVQDRAWTIHFEGDVAKVMDRVVRLRRLDAQGVVSAMLHSWTQKSPKAKFARERLCDTAIRCLSRPVNH